MKDRCGEIGKGRCGEIGKDRCGAIGKDCCGEIGKDRCGEIGKDRCGEIGKDRCGEIGKDRCGEIGKDRCGEIGKDRCGEIGKDRCGEIGKDRCGEIGKDRCGEIGKDRCGEIGKVSPMFPPRHRSSAKAPTMSQLCMITTHNNRRELANDVERSPCPVQTATHAVSQRRTVISPTSEGLSASWIAWYVAENVKRQSRVKNSSKITTPHSANQTSDQPSLS